MHARVERIDYPEKDTYTHTHIYVGNPIATGSPPAEVLAHVTKVYLTTRVAAPFCSYVNRVHNTAMTCIHVHVYGIVTTPKFTTF